MYTQSSKIDHLKMSTTNIVLRSTRKVKMKKDFTSKTRVYNSPLYRGLRLWDSLPENILKETDKASLKRELQPTPYNSVLVVSKYYRPLKWVTKCQ